MFLSVIPGLLAAAIVYAIRRTATPRRRERQPVRFTVRPLLAGPLGRLLAGVAAFEIGNCASTLLILRATDLFAARYGRTAAAQLAVLLYVGYNVAAALISVPAGRPGPGAGRRGGAVRSRVRLVRGRPRPSRCCCPRSC